MDELVDVTTFHADPERQSGAVLKAEDELFSSVVYPNLTAVGVNRLARFDFETKVIARIPG